MMHPRRAIPLASLLWLVTHALACGSDDLEAQVRALGEGCLLDSDCEADLVCVFRRCHIECAETPDCVERGLDTICVLGDKPTNVCLLPDESSCSTTSDCPGDTVCGRDDLCRDPCATDGDCVAGQVCLKGTCADLETLSDDSPLLSEEKGGPQDTCRYNSECSSPLACRGGLCEEECLGERDCPDGDMCTTVEGADLPDALACVTPVNPPVGPDPNGPEHCKDGVISGDETAIDCGGSCRACAPGAGCMGPTDCVSQVCNNGVCQVPTCSDGQRNGTETGVDCGGACPNGCPAGTDCMGPGDCMAPATCDIASGKCVGPTCSDGQLNGNETSIDCGGLDCAPCPVGQSCLSAGDCSSLVCGGGICLNPSCTDGIQNQGEADVDCGGTGNGCAACGNGANCTAPTDCVSQSCSMGTCTAPSCTDMVQNGFELGVDCGGGCPTGCPLGTTCLTDADCDPMGGTAGCNPQTLVCTTKRNITVNVTGQGSGTVTSTSPPGLINCGTQCTGQLFEGQSFSLTATPGGNSSFGGFGGDCSGPTCTVQVGINDATVNATFNPDALGSANWVFNPGAEEIWHINTDALGNLLVAGQSKNGTNLGCFISAQNSQEAFFGRYAPGPNALGDSCIGVRVDGAIAAADQGIGIHTDTVTGNIVGLMLMDDPTVNGMPLACGATTGKRLVLVEYAPTLNMNAVLARCYGNAKVGVFGASNDIRITDQLYTANDELYLVGSVGGSGVVVSDPLGPAVAPITASGSTDGIVIKLDSSRNVVATYTFGGNTFQSGEEVLDAAIAPMSGDLILATYARDAVDFGGGFTFLGNPSDVDAYVVRLSTAINPPGFTTVWVRQFAGANNDRATAVAVLPGGNIAVGLETGNVMDFGDGFQSQPFPGAGAQDRDIVLVELNAAGALAAPGAWRRYGSIYNEVVRDIWIDPVTGETVWAGTSLAAQNSTNWSYEGTTMTSSVWVAKTPTFLSPPTWVNQTGTSIGTFSSSLVRMFVSPVDKSIWVQSNQNMGIDWGLGNTGFLPRIHRLNP